MRKYTQLWYLRFWVYAGWLYGVRALSSGLVGDVEYLAFLSRGAGAELVCVAEIAAIVGHSRCVVVSAWRA